MADLTVKQKQIFDNYKKTHPKMSDAEILSALVNFGQIQLSEDQKASLFFNSSSNNSKMGLQLEHSANPTNQAETVFLQSGRKIVITKSQDGKDLYKYYAADGTQLKPDYFKKQEGVVRVSANRKTYTVTKNGNTTVKKAKDPLMVKIDQQQAELNKTKKQQGFLGKSWDWFKNTTGIGDGSNKAQKQLDAERKLVQQIQNGKISKKDFKEVTGLDYSQENLQKFKSGELGLKSTEKIKGYQEGQEMATDMIADMTAGMVAFGIYTAAVAAAPFTGGASIAVGVVAATATGSLLKTGLKYADAKSGGREYKGKEFGKDMLTGGLSGVLAPVTAGFGGAVGKTVATKFGVQAVTQVGKQVTKEVGMELAEQGGKEVLKGGFKQTFKTLLTKPTALTFEGGSRTGRILAWGAEASTAGAVWGGVDGGARTTYDQVESGEGIDVGQIAMSTVEGTVGGAVAGLGFGGAMKGVGKFWGKVFGKGKPKAETPKPNTTTAEPKPKKTMSFGKKTTEGLYTEIGEQFKTPEMKLVDVSVKGNRKIAPEGEYIKELPDAYKMIGEDGVEYLRPSVEIDAIEAITPKNGAGTRILQKIIAYANEHHEGRLFLMAAKSEGKDSPLLFYYKNGLRSTDEKINQILEKVLKGELPMSAIPESSVMYLPPKTSLSTAATESINKILSSYTYSVKADRLVLEHLLTEKTLPMVERFVNKETTQPNLLRFLDVVRRRKYNISDLEKILGEKQVIDEKLLHTLEFKNFEKAKNVTLENFNELSLQEKKDFINGIISINFRGGEKKHVDVLPDMAIFRNLKSRKAPQKTGNSKEAQNLFFKQNADYIAKNEKEYTTILNSLLEQIPRGKQAIPTSTNGLNPNSVLTVKPPITSNVSSIPTSTAKVGSHNVRVGVISEEGNYFTHSLEEHKLSRLEGYLLTDPDAILSTGLLGRKGRMKSGETRPSIIVSPKNSMEDLLIASNNDASAGYGARRNFFNVQNMFLTETNEHNNYLPNLLKQKLNLTTEEYNLRMSKIKDITHIEDLEAVDKELYTAIKSVISENPIYESIMRPNVEAIYLPKGMKISEEIASFAERYDIPILFKDAADMPATRKPYVKPTVEQKSIVPKEDVMASTTHTAKILTREEFEQKLPILKEQNLIEYIEVEFKKAYPNRDIKELYSLTAFDYAMFDKSSSQNRAYLRWFIKHIDNLKDFPFERYQQFLKDVNAGTIAGLRFNEGITPEILDRYAHLLTKRNFPTVINNLTKENLPILDKYIAEGKITPENISRLMKFNTKFDSMLTEYFGEKVDNELFESLIKLDIRDEHYNYIELFKNYVDRDNIMEILKKGYFHFPKEKINVPEELLGTIITKENFIRIYSDLEQIINLGLEKNKYFKNIDWNKYRNYVLAHTRDGVPNDVLELMNKNVEPKVLGILTSTWPATDHGGEQADFAKYITNMSKMKEWSLIEKLELHEQCNQPLMIEYAKKDPLVENLFNQFKSNLESELLHPVPIIETSKVAKNNFMQLISNNPAKSQKLEKLGIQEIKEVIYAELPEIKTLTKDDSFAKLLQDIVKAPEFNNLDDKSKFGIKLAAILSTVKPEHANALMEKLNLQYGTRRYVLDLLNATKRFTYNKSSLIDINHLLATQFPTENKLNAAKLFSKIKDGYILPEETENMVKIAQLKLYKTGVPAFSTRLPKGQNLGKIPTVKYNGKEYQVLNLLEEQGDLSAFGFVPGTTLDNFSVNATFVRDVNEANTMFLSGNPIISGIPSTSKIGLGQNASFQERLFAVLVEDVDKADYIFANMKDTDIGHGVKNIFVASQKMFNTLGEDNGLRHRIYMANLLKERLGLSHEQYGELYKQILDKKYISQIKSLKIDGKEVSPQRLAEIKTALEDVQKDLVSKDFYKGNHNETNLSRPEVNQDFILAKVNDISEIPQEWLDFAERNHKKFILIGNSQENTKVSPEQLLSAKGLKSVQAEDVMASTTQLAKSVAEKVQQTLSTEYKAIIEKDIRLSDEVKAVLLQETDVNLMQKRMELCKTLKYEFRISDERYNSLIKELPVETIEEKLKLYELVKKDPQYEEYIEKIFFDKNCRTIEDLRAIRKADIELKLKQEEEIKQAELLKQKQELERQAKVQASYEKIEQTFGKLRLSILKKNFDDYRSLDKDKMINIISECIERAKALGVEPKLERFEEIAKTEYKSGFKIKLTDIDELFGENPNITKLIRSFGLGGSLILHEDYATILQNRLKLLKSILECKEPPILENDKIWNSQYMNYLQSIFSYLGQDNVEIRMKLLKLACLKDENVHLVMCMIESCKSEEIYNIVEKISKIEPLLKNEYRISNIADVIKHSEIDVEKLNMFLDYVIQNKDFSESKLFDYYADSIISKISSQDSYLPILEKIIYNKDIYNNESITKYFNDLISSSDYDRNQKIIANNKLSMFNYIFEEPKLLKNKELLEKWLNNIRFITDDVAEMDAKVQYLKQIFSNNYDESKYADKFFNSFSSIDSMEDTQNFLSAIKIISTDKFSEELVEKIMVSSHNKNVLEFIKFVAGNEKLMNDKVFINDYFGDIISNLAEKSGLSFENVMKIINTPELFTKENLILCKNIGRGKYISQDEAIQNAIFKWIENKKISRNLIIELAKNLDENSIKFIDKYIDNPNFEPKTALQDILGVFSSYLKMGNDSTYREIAEILCEYQTFPKNLIADIIKYSHQGNKELILKLANDKNFAKENIPRLSYLTQNSTSVIYSLEDLNNRIALIEKLAFDKELGFPQNGIASFVESRLVEDISDPKLLNAQYMKCFKEIASKDGTAIDMTLADAFFDFYGKSRYQELSRTQKREFLYKLLEQKNNISSEENTGILSLIPKNEQEYADIIKIITNDLNMNLKPLSSGEIDLFTNELNRLATVGSTNIERTQIKEICKNIAKYIPEIFAEGKANISDDLVLIIEKVIKNKSFEKLSDKDKQILFLSTLLQADRNGYTATDKAFDAYYIAKKFNLSNSDANRIYSIVESSDLIQQFMATTKNKTVIGGFRRGQTIEGTEREDLFDLAAFRLQNNNDFELARMLYSASEPEGLTRHFDKLLQHRIREIKATNFIMPQTAKSVYEAKAKPMTIWRDGKQYTVYVVKRSEIENFFAFMHTPEAGFASGGSRTANLANFDILANIKNNKVISTNYISNDFVNLVADHGFVLIPKNNSQHVISGFDIYSLGKNVPSMLIEYYRDRGVYNAYGKLRYSERVKASNALKEILHPEYTKLVQELNSAIDLINKRYDSIIDNAEKALKKKIQQLTGKENPSYQEYKAIMDNPEIKELRNTVADLKQNKNTALESIPSRKKVEQIDDDYISRLDKILEIFGNEPWTPDQLAPFDEEMANAYKTLLARDAQDSRLSEKALMKTDNIHHNEAIVSEVEVGPIYTNDINKIPIEYLELAQTRPTTFLLVNQ